MCRGHECKSPEAGPGLVSQRNTEECRARWSEQGKQRMEETRRASRGWEGHCKHCEYFTFCSELNDTAAENFKQTNNMS